MHCTYSVFNFLIYWKFKLTGIQITDVCVWYKRIKYLYSYLYIHTRRCRNKYNCKLINSLIYGVAGYWRFFLYFRVANCRTANLKQKTCAELTANYLVCGKHSEDRMFMNSGTRSSLVHNAVPTLFNFPHQSSSPAKAFRKRKLPTVDELHMHSPPPESDKNSESVVLISEEKSQTENQAKVNEDICMSTTISSLQPERLPTLLSHNVKAIPVVKAPQKSLPTSRVSPSHLKTSSSASAKNSQPTSQNVPKW